MNALAENGAVRPHVVVIGGGATGTGIARDAALRGFKVTLVERGALGDGASGHFHGMLHSGARYVVNDPLVAAECFEENQRLRRIIPSAIRDTGGMFVAVNAQEAAHADTIMHDCMKAGIPTREISIGEAIKREPHLTHAVTRAFLVPDAFIDGTELLRLNHTAARQADVPAMFLEHHAVDGFDVHAGVITAVTVRDTRTSKTTHLKCDYVVNAAGVWAGQVATLASVPFEMIFDKGTMMVFRYQFSSAVLNRCRPENDGDLLVPDGAHSIMGTTARVITDPNACLPTQEEVDVLLKEGSELIPQLRGAEVTKIYAGVRPLFRANDQPLAGEATRAVSRSFRVLDHGEQGVANFVSIVGGKVTLYRRMAEATVDLLCVKNNARQKITTAVAAVS